MASKAATEREGNPTISEIRPQNKADNWGKKEFSCSKQQPMTATKGTKWELLPTMIRWSSLGGKELRDEQNNHSDSDNGANSSNGKCWNHDL